jgi:hypothetical protein
MRIGDFIIKADKDFVQDRHFFIYEASITSPDFEVYEGDGAEVFSLDEIRQRHDVIGSARYALANIIKDR